MSEVCFECGAIARERHHVIPKSRGGTKTVWLCCECHGKVHGMKRMDVRQLTKEALAKKKAEGFTLGRPLVVCRETDARVLELRAQGLSMAKIAEILNRECVPTSSARDDARWYAGTVRLTLLRHGRSA